MNANKENVAGFFSDIEKFPMLCQSCGMCEGICPTKAITISHNFATQFVPNYDASKCIGCMKCINACPVRTNVREKQTVIGNYYKIFIGKSTKKENIEKGSSGGIVTALAQYGLDCGIFSEILTVSNKDSVVVAKPVYTTTPEEESGSKYVSAPLCTIYDKNKKNLAATALPCQAKAIRKQSKDTFIFGLFCSKLSLEDLVNYVIKKEGKTDSEITEITYRRGNWPGKFNVKFSDGTQISQNLNRSNFNSAYNSYNFSCSGCLLCDDYFAEEADISVGDPWGRPQYCDDYLGETVIVIRSKRGLELVENAVKSGVITVKEMDLEQVIKGHLKEIYNKKTAIAQRMAYMDSKTDAMKSYDRNILIKAKNFSLLNKYAIENNWKRRTSAEKYKKVFKTPIRLMFVKRFSHAFLLTRLLKSGNNCKLYLDIAKAEKQESEK